MKQNFTFRMKKHYVVGLLMLLGTSSFGQGLLITTEVCGPAATQVRMTGPFWGWDPNGGPIATDNGNGTWTVNLNPAPTADMEYLFIVDGVQENLISDMLNGGTCAPVTDYTNYANRKWTVGSGNVTGISFDRCVSCNVPDLVITTEICDTVAVTGQVNLTGPIWGWNPAFGPQAVDNGNGTWTFTLSPAPADTFEYLLVRDGVMESLIQAMVDGGSCAPVTDYFSYANRQWGLGDLTSFTNTYGSCVNCASLSITENALNNVDLYPNPTNSVITVKSENKIDAIIIYNVVGEKVSEIQLNAKSTVLDMSEFSNGIYNLVILAEGSTSHAKIVKK